MYVGVFHFEVQPENQAAFLQAVREQIKPYWETHECWAYNVYQEYGAESGQGIHFIKTQVMEGQPRSIEEARARRTPEAQTVVDLFYKYAEGVQFKAYFKLV